MGSRYFVNLPLLLTAALPCSLANDVAAATELGVRVSALRAHSNQHGLGLIARWPLAQGYFVQATLDRRAYGHSRDALPMPPARLHSVVVGAAIGRNHFDTPALASWFWSWGVSAGFPARTQAGADATALIFDAATEIHLTASLGVSKRLAEHWSLTGTARVERQFPDWRLTDTAGHMLDRRTAQTAHGFSLSLNYQF